MAQHTPGPWTYGKAKKMGSVDGKARLVDDRGWFIAAESRRFDLAAVHHTASQDADEQEANARLISLAPALYDRALLVVKLFGTDDLVGQAELCQAVKDLRGVLRQIQAA